MLNPSATGISTGNEIGNLIDPLFGINQGSASTMGGEVGGGVGALIGMLFGPLGSALGGLGGGLLGDVVGGWIGGGVPTETKTTGIASALGSSGNPLDALIAQFINNKGVTQDNPLSSGSFDEATRRFAAMVEALTGQKAPEATATGFNNNPTWQNPAMGRAIKGFQLPAGYEFVNDPSKFADIFKDVSGAVGSSASTAFSGPDAQNEWQRVLRELIQQGALTKYQGPLGAPGGTPNTAPGAIPNISLPHPLAQNQPAMTPTPYPV